MTPTATPIGVAAKTSHFAWGLWLVLMLVVVATAGCGGNDLAEPNDAINGPGPRQNRDHWHAVYGVWDCTLNEDQGGWLPHFDSDDDATGLHSHDDGLIYIHPFMEWSAGQNAVLGHFANEMRLHLNDHALVLDDGRTLAEADASCGGESVTLHLRHWDTDVDARAGRPPQIITQNLRTARFRNDFEVWVIAFAPLDAELPLPPEERFDQLNLWKTPVG